MLSSNDLFRKIIVIFLLVLSFIAVSVYGQPETDNKQSVSLQKQVPLTFMLQDLRIRGTHYLPLITLQSIYREKVGKPISLDELHQIAGQITQHYHKEGYILTQAILPAQTIQDGIVTIQVVEGYIASIDIEGKMTKPNKALLFKLGEWVKNSKPLHARALERYVLSANEIPGLTVQTILKPSKVPGASDLILLTNSRFIEAFISFDNRLSKRYGPQQVTLQGVLNQLLPGSRTTASGKFSTILHRMYVLSAMHTQFLNANGLKLNISMHYAKNHPYVKESGFHNIHIEGQSRLFHVDLSYAITKRKDLTCTIRQGLDMQHALSTVKVTNTLRRTEDNIQSFKLGIDTQYLDHYWGNNFFVMELSKGINILGNFNRGNHSRPDGKANFIKINFDISRLQKLTQSTSLLLAIQGQYAFDKLLASEEFGFGGSAIGRGYDSSEITGDHGIAMKLEFKYNFSSKFMLLSNIQWYTFLDGGRVWPIYKQTLLPRNLFMSVGSGIKASFTSNFLAAVEVVKPLSKDIINNKNRSINLFFTIVAWL